MFGIGEKNKKPKIKKDYIIVFDIRNSSVGAAVIEKTDYYNQIIYTNRKYLNSSANENPSDFKKNSFKIMQEIIDEIHKDEINKIIVKNIEKVLCVFSSPWYESKIENFITKQEKPTLFTKDFLNKKINVSKFKDTNKEAIENDIISINLNGYNVSDPYKKQFTEAKVSFYRGIIDKKVKNYLEDKIKDNFKTKKVILHTHPFAVLTSLKNNFHSINDFCLFDISGNTSEVSIYREGVYKKMVSIPKGFNHLVNKISSDDNSTKQNSISKIKLFSEKQTVDPTIETKIIDGIKEIFNEIKTKEDKESEDSNIPHSIFITTDKEFEKTFLETFKKKEFYNAILGLNIEPIVRVIDSQTTKDLILYRENVERDPILSILSNFSTIDF